VLILGASASAQRGPRSAPRRAPRIDSPSAASRFPRIDSPPLREGQAKWRDAFRRPGLLGRIRGGWPRRPRGAHPDGRMPRERASTPRGNRRDAEVAEVRIGAWKSHEPTFLGDLSRLCGFLTERDVTNGQPGVGRSRTWRRRPGGGIDAMRRRWSKGGLIEPTLWYLTHRAETIGDDSHAFAFRAHHGAVSLRRLWRW